MEALDVPPEAIVETELARFAKLHDTGGSKAFRMRGHAKPVARRQRHPADDVGMAEGPFEDDSAFVDNCNYAARLLGVAQLIVKPLRDIVEGRLQPVVHLLHL